MWVDFVIIMSYNHQNGQTGPFMVWVNDKQDSVLVNFVLESLKNGHESLKLVSKMALKRLNTNFGPYHPENQEYLFRCSIAPGNFLLAQRFKKSCSIHFFSKRIFWRLFVNHLVNNQGIWLVVVEKESWYFVHCCGMWSEGNQEKNT